MVSQVIIDKAGDEVIAVVIALLHSNFQGVMGADAGLLEAAGFQFFTEKFILCTLVDQDG